MFKKSIKTTALLSAIFLSLLFVNFAGNPSINRVGAIRCADGSTRDDADANNCPSKDASSSTGSGVSNSYCDQNPTDCAPIEPGGLTNSSTGTDGKQCGKGKHKVVLSMNIGCIGQGFPGPDDINPIIDMAFALFRFLSAGVGLVLIASIIYAGIQYSASRGNPQAVEASIKRITSTVIALLLYMFMFALANYLVPGGLFIR